MFKFQIGQKAHHKGYIKNVVVRARIDYEDCDGGGKYYDLYFIDSDCKCIDMVPEYWLQEGHKME